MVTTMLINELTRVELWEWITRIGVYSDVAVKIQTHTFMYRPRWILQRCVWDDRRRHVSQKSKLDVFEKGVRLYVACSCYRAEPRVFMLIEQSAYKVFTVIGYRLWLPLAWIVTAFKIMRRWSFRENNVCVYNFGKCFIPCSTFERCCPILW